MGGLPRKTITTKRGFTYAYYASPAAAEKPTVFLHHGFPDSADEWEDLITHHLEPAGYGVIAPDLLGYGGTSKPTDPAAYKYRGMTADVVEIMDAEKVDKIVALGHDWGSSLAQSKRYEGQTHSPSRLFLLFPRRSLDPGELTIAVFILDHTPATLASPSSRQTLTLRLEKVFYNLHPDRVSGLAMVNVPYAVTAHEPTDLDGWIAQSEKTRGYGSGWYWKFMTADDGAKVMEENVDVLFDILHAPEVWVATLGTKDGFRRALEGRGEGFNIKRRAYATQEMENLFVERMRRDGFEGPVCWYKCKGLGHQDVESDPSNLVVKVPTLFLGYPEDAVCIKEAILPSVKAGLLPHLTNITLEGGHWGLVEHPKEFGEAVTQWLDTNYGSSNL